MTPFRQRQEQRRAAERERPAVAARPRPLARLWRAGGALWKGTATLVAGVFAAVLLGLSGLVFVEAVAQRSIVLEPIAVPKPVAEAGFTPEIAAIRLGDALEAMVHQAATDRQTIAAVQTSDLADVVVPTVGVSVQSLAATVRNVLGIKRRRRISGEMVLAAGTLSLELRLDGALFFRSPTPVDRERPTDLLPDAAFATLRQTQPYVFAALTAHDAPDLALETTNAAIWTARNDDEAGNLHNVRGNIFAAAGRSDDAFGEYRQASSYLPHDPLPLMNHGNALMRAGHSEAAMVKYQQALALAPDSARANDSVGDMLSLRGDIDGALASYRRAVPREADAPYAPLRIASLLTKRRQFAEAAEEYRWGLFMFDARRQRAPRRFEPPFDVARLARAIPLAHPAAIGPDEQAAHIGLGYVLFKQGRDDEAMAQYRLVLAQAPANAYALVGLGDVLGHLGRDDEAAARFRAAIAARPDLARPHASLGLLLVRTGQHEAAAAELASARAVDPDDELTRQLGIALSAALAPLP